MRFQIIVPPIRKEYGKVPPYGALSIARALHDDGHHIALIDADLERLSDNMIFDRIKEFNPDIIGFTSIVATSYKFIKRLSLIIKKRFPEKKIILGGHLSPVWNTLLQSTGVDIVVDGEGEVAVVELFDALQSNTSLQEVPSLAFREGNKLITTRPAPSIRDLDKLGYPLFEILDMKSYLFDAYSSSNYLDNFRRHPDFVSIYKDYPNVFSVVFTRGCIRRCTFCHRHYIGFRSPSPNYILDYLEYLQKTYKVGFFYFSNELTCPNVNSHLRFIEEIRNRKINGFKFLFSIGGLVVNLMTREVLKGYKEVGAVRAEVGYETGSQKMLDIMEKKTTVEININAAGFANEFNLYNAGNIVLGLPGETADTVLETADFLDRVALIPAVNYVQALPGSAIYEYAKLKNIIVDEDRYLESVSNTDAGDISHYINYTDSSYLEVIQWRRFLITVLRYRQIKRKYGFIIGIIFLFLASGYVILNSVRKCFSVFLKGNITKESFQHVKNELISSPYFLKLIITKGFHRQLDLSKSARVKERGESLRKTILYLKENIT